MPKKKILWKDSCILARANSMSKEQLEEELKRLDKKCQDALQYNDYFLHDYTARIYNLYNGVYRRKFPNAD